MTKKTIYMIEEISGYCEDGYDLCQSSVIESYEYKDDAKLALWYWYCDQVDQDLDTAWVDDSCACSEGYDMLSERLDRCISEVSLYS